jgi:hypothetical protein
MFSTRIFKPKQLDELKEAKDGKIQERIESSNRVLELRVYWIRIGRLEKIRCGRRRRRAYTLTIWGLKMKL